MKMDPVIRKTALTRGIAVMNLMGKEEESFILVNVQILSILIYVEGSPAYQDEHTGVYASSLVEKTPVADQIAAGEKFCRMRGLGSIV